MSEYAIDVTNLSKRFGGKIAVNHITLKVKTGEIFGFLGPNGSGKTTTLRMLCGLLTPDTGEGHCLHFNVRTQSYQIKSKSGYMTQKFSLYEELSVWENLDFMAQIYQISNKEKKISDALNMFALENRKNQLTKTLSGGFKQRLALAAALLHSPSLLLLDEPTAGVDPKARRDFWEQIQELSAQGVTTLVSTHYMDEAERCTRLAYIANGNILISGTAEEIVLAANLTTWEIQSTDSQLIKKLKTLPSVEQVTIFGHVIHVSGKEKEKLKQDILSLHIPVSCKEVVSQLEDVFIALDDNPW